MSVDIVRHRHLLAVMVRREVSSRFVGTSLGGLWSLIQPAIMLALYTMVFSVIYKVKEVGEGHGFPEFVFCGLWPWLAFQEACTRSVTAITQNANMVKKLQFPSELLVVAVVTSSFIVQGIGFFLFLLGLMVWNGAWLPATVVLLVIPFGLSLSLAVGLGMLLACGNVFFRDIEQVALASFTLWFFLTPILYPKALIPASVERILMLNPMVGIVDSLRSMILDGTFSPDLSLIYSAGVAIALAYLGIYAFGRCRGFFADYL